MNGHKLQIFVIMIEKVILFVHRFNGRWVCTQEGFSDPPSVSSISRLLRGGRPAEDGKKDYTINGILGGGKSKLFFFVFSVVLGTHYDLYDFFCAINLKR